MNKPQLKNDMIGEGRKIYAVQNGHYVQAQNEAAQPALALDAPQAAIESDKSGAAHQ